jgi:hypothetical protein
MSEVIDDTGPEQQPGQRPPAESTLPQTPVFTNCVQPQAQKPPIKRPKKNLTRVPFMVSRLMEFCTRRELVNQTGHDELDWALVVQKEITDNAIDEAEEVGRAPVVQIDVNGTKITFTVDHIRQEPKITHTTTSSCIVRGTRITVDLPPLHWGQSAHDIVQNSKPQFLALAEAYAWLNPHLSLRLIWNGETKIDIETANPNPRRISASAPDD